MTGGAGCKRTNRSLPGPSATSSRADPERCQRLTTLRVLALISDSCEPHVPISTGLAFAPKAQPFSSPGNAPGNGRQRGLSPGRAKQDGRHAIAGMWQRRAEAFGLPGDVGPAGLLRDEEADQLGVGVGQLEGFLLAAEVPLQPMVASRSRGRSASASSPKANLSHGSSGVWCNYIGSTTNTRSSSPISWATPGTRTQMFR